MSEFVKQLTEERDLQVVAKIFPMERLPARQSYPNCPSGEQTIKDRLNERRTKEFFALGPLECNAESFTEVFCESGDGLAELGWQLRFRLPCLTRQHFGEALRLSDCGVARRGSLDD